MNKLTGQFAINKYSHLTIDGCDCVELAKKFGTPLYVMSEDTIREACRKYKESIKKYYDDFGNVCYAGKAMSCLELCRIADSEGLNLDVVSDGELYTALKAGFPCDKIHFHGNNKTDEELKMALDNKVGHIIVDNFYELRRLNNLAEKRNIKPVVTLRITPGIDAHTHEFIKTGQIDSKFGFTLPTGEAMLAVKEAVSCNNIELRGLHCHIGSQIFDVQPFMTAAECMLDFIAEIKSNIGYEISELDLGGGFGIHYVESDDPIEYDSYIHFVSETIKSKCKELGIKIPYIYIEPGRSVVGESGITLYTVGSIKNIEGIRTYVSVDGGMTDNIRYALYGSEYTALIANKADKVPNVKVTVAGKCCESGDVILEDTLLNNPQSGDILAVYSTGAYNYSMASNYNRIRRPAVVMITNRKPRVIVKRETFEDIIKNDI